MSSVGHDQDLKNMNRNTMEKKIFCIVHKGRFCFMKCSFQLILKCVYEVGKYFFKLWIMMEIGL